MIINRFNILNGGKHMMLAESGFRTDGAQECPGNCGVKSC
jgi:hypothetical protein